MVASLVRTCRVRTESWILKNRDSAWKKWQKGLGIFLKLQQVLYKFFLFWSNRIQSRSLRFFKVSTDHLFDNLESGKKNYCFGKKVCKKSWILDPKICTNPIITHYLGASFALFGKGIQPLLNACVVVRIIIALNFFFNKLHCCTPCTIFQ